MDQDILQLKENIASIEAYKKQIEAIQVKFPLDGGSLSVIHQDLLVPTGNVVIPYSLASYTESVQADLDGKKYLLVTTPIS